MEKGTSISQAGRRWKRRKYKMIICFLFESAIRTNIHDLGPCILYVPG